DAPPLLAFGDTMTLSPHVDAIFAITRLSRVQRPILHEFGRQLQNCQSRLLGYVLTGVEHSESYRYMYEAYEYYARGTPSDKERVSCPFQQYKTVVPAKPAQPPTVGVAGDALVPASGPRSRGARVPPWPLARLTSLEH